MLTATDLAYRLPTGRLLFEQVSVSVRPGEALAIRAPSGTGKSTLLALLGGLLQPSAGHVMVDSPNRSPFAWILQTLNALGARSVLANVALLSVLDGSTAPEARRRAADAMRAVGIDLLAESKGRQLSGGELQRLAVARALASDRPIVLADEPTNQLDRANARVVMNALYTAAAEHQRCVVIVTHDHDALPSAMPVLDLSERGLHAR
jgi:ABC-type lipoprotein export system ATPase subunit